MKMRLSKMAIGLSLSVSLALPLGLPVMAATTVIAAPVVSPALTVLAAQDGMEAAALCGNRLHFSAADFARAMNMAEELLTCVTITTLPPVSDGTLYLGSFPVTEGQTITKENLTALNFEAAEESQMQSRFLFTVNRQSYDIPCVLSMLSDVNATPTIPVSALAALQVQTHENRSIAGYLRGYDPEGDALTFMVVSYPQEGLFVLEDRHTGRYTYYPRKDSTGCDEVVYVVKDPYGNMSASATVKISVEAAKTAVEYVDVLDSTVENAAMTMTEAGVMSGTRVGDRDYFYPDQSVSRVEFLVMAMQSIGMATVPDAQQTGYADDEDIPMTMKGYVVAAARLGICIGTEKEGLLWFVPDGEITRAEASVIVAGLLSCQGGTVRPVFADSTEIPAWAQEAVYALNEIGILDANDGKIAARDVMTRGSAALMLTRAAVAGRAN